MLNRFVKALGVCMCVPLVLAFAGNLASAETPIRIDYGTIEAIEVHRAPDNQPVNVGTVLGGVAGGVKHCGDDRRRDRRGSRRQRNREEAGAGLALPDHGATRFRQHASLRGQARRQLARWRPCPRRSFPPSISVCQSARSSSSRG